MAAGCSAVADGNRGRAGRAIGREMPAVESWAPMIAAWVEADCGAREETPYITNVTFDRTQATSIVSLSRRGTSDAASNIRDLAFDQSLVGSSISLVAPEQKSLEIEKSGLGTSESHLTSKKSQARPEQTDVTSSISRRAPNQSEARFEHSQATTSKSHRGAKQTRAAREIRAVGCELSLLGAKQSEARFEQSVLTSVGCDVNTELHDADSVGCKLASGSRNVAMAGCDIMSSECDVIPDIGEIGA